MIKEPISRNHQQADVKLARQSLQRNLAAIMKRGESARGMRMCVVLVLIDIDIKGDIRTYGVRWVAGCLAFIQVIYVLHFKGAAKIAKHRAICTAQSPSVKLRYKASMFSLAVYVSTLLARSDDSSRVGDIENTHALNTYTTASFDPLIGERMNTSD